MTVKQLLIGLALWLGLAGVAGYWAWRPTAWALTARGSTPADVQKAFFVRLASLPASATAQHYNQIVTEDADSELGFDATDWALREGRYRWGFVFPVWMLSGFAIHWLIGQIVRGKQDFT